MRPVRKLLALAVVAVAGMGLAASSAGAQTPTVEFLNEATGLHCGAVSLSTHTVSGGCAVHMTGEDDMVLTGHQFGIETTLTDCASEFTARFDEGAEGYLTGQALSTPASGTCNHRPCDEAGGAVQPWRIHGDATGAGGRHGIFTFCLEPTGGSLQSSCTVEAALTLVSVHRYEVTANDAPCTGSGQTTAELSGHWVAEATPGSGETNVEEQPERPEFTNEATGSHCSAISVSTHSVSGGCPVHMVGADNVVITRHVFGIEVPNTCTGEFTVRWDEDAEGYATSQTLSAPSTGGTCNFQPCNEGGGTTDPWQIHANEIPGGKHATATICIQPTSGGGQVPCAVELQMTPLASAHRDRLAVDDGSCAVGSGHELTASWVAESTPSGSETNIEDVTVEPEPDTVELVNELTGVPCFAGCDIHGQGELTFVSHVLGAESNLAGGDCNIEFVGDIGHDGEGQVTNLVLVDHPAVNDCTQVPCMDGLSVRPWPLHIDEVAPGTLSLTMELCFGSPMRSFSCPFVVTETANHDYDFTVNDTRCTGHIGSDLEATGQLELETDAEAQPLEVIHIGP